jgi:hypothetical protein
MIDLLVACALKYHLSGRLGVQGKRANKTEAEPNAVRPVGLYTTPISGERAKAPAMTGPVQTVRKLWLAATGHHEPAASKVVIFDPTARRAHDLDDPFFDDNIQIRMADVIAATGNKKCKNGY